MSRTFISAALVSILCCFPVHAQTPGSGLCEKDPDVCNGGLRDAAGVNDTGGIGSKKGTGGEGTNAVRPPDGLSPPIAAPVPLPNSRLPNIPRRFGF